jgi:hypothetical protein
MVTRKRTNAQTFICKFSPWKLKCVPWSVWSVWLSLWYLQTLLINQIIIQKERVHISISTEKIWRYWKKTQQFLCCGETRFLRIFQRAHSSFVVSASSIGDVAFFGDKIYSTVTRSMTGVIPIVMWFNTPQSNCCNFRLLCFGSSCYNRVYRRSLLTSQLI